MKIIFLGYFPVADMKKKLDECIFGIFQCSGTNEKKKTECCCAEPFLGYCPNDIVRKYFVLQVSGLYCRDLSLNG